MTAIYDQHILRQDLGFRDYIATAVMHVANIIKNEDPETPAHDARAEMARLIIETNDQKSAQFIEKVIFRAVTEPAIRESVVRNGVVSTAFADEAAIEAGILGIWNETTLAVWPTIMEDIAGV